MNREERRARVLAAVAASQRAAAAVRADRHERLQTPQDRLRARLAQDNAERALRHAQRLAYGAVEREARKRVSCPACRAVPGQACLAGGRGTRAHHERVTRYRAALAAIREAG